MNDVRLSLSYRSYAFTQNKFSGKTQTVDLTSHLLACGMFAEPLPPSTLSRPPRIHSKSAHYRFALHVLAGYSYAEACVRLDISPRTAERWRTDLRRTASRYFGRPVTYAFAARYALDGALRSACESALRETPQ